MRVVFQAVSRRAALLGVAAWGVAAVLAGTSARAEFVFNPTGGGAPGALTLTGFDPLPGNAVAQGAVTAIANAQANGGGDTAGNQFLLYYQAAVGSLLPASQNPPGLNHDYQITFTGVVREYVSSVAGGTAVFSLSADQTGSVLNMYQGAPVTYSDLNGTGFTAGTQILSATPVPNGSTAGNFTNTGITTGLDQHGNNDWGATQTVIGFGGSVINFHVTSGNSNYFVTPPPSSLALTFSTTQNLPFTTVDPALALFNGTATNVGAINGVSGPDILLQADANVSAVPEPSSVCLTALGVGGLLLYARRKRAQVG